MLDIIIIIIIIVIISISISIIKYPSFLFELLSTVTKYATSDFHPFPWTFSWRSMTLPVARGVWVNAVVECDKASETTNDWVLYFFHEDNTAESG
jgi:hypothetical protein